jgi:hypothetical protein
LIIIFDSFVVVKNIDVDIHQKLSKVCYLSRIEMRRSGGMAWRGVAQKNKQPSDLYSFILKEINHFYIILTKTKQKESILIIKY